MKKPTKWILGLIATVPLIAQAQGNLAALDHNMMGPRARVLVLGTVHLRYMPTGFNEESLNGVLKRLESFKPDIITIETLPGEECDLVARHPAKYGPPELGGFCPSNEPAKTATGLDIPAALVEVEKTLKAWPTQAAPAQRRRLAAAFLAARDSASAYVQWLHLPEAERCTGDGLNTELVEQLKQIATRNDEGYQIAARLAARLGLQRIYATDNHTGDNVDVEDEKAYERAKAAAWSEGRSELNEREKQVNAFKLMPDLLPLYRYINDPVHQRILADTEVGALMRAKSPKGYPQMWVAGWEIRNLRMIANIRETFRERPGARVLTIVGSSHKPWFDAWLGQLQGVDIVDVIEVLR
ncbi:DUF5694 domain-containing protein [Undibacterium sp. JH2W]|uniref:DUF5694 domain-containing protein n=1 Tax=Undibacterium sp. JH2W TaxID=3413037 RepID=UPI003BF11028